MNRSYSITDKGLDLLSKVDLSRLASRQDLFEQVAIQLGLSETALSILYNLDRHIVISMKYRDYTYYRKSLDLLLNKGLIEGLDEFSD